MHGIREYVEAGGLMSWTNIAVPLKAPMWPPGRLGCTLMSSMQAPNATSMQPLQPCSKSTRARCARSFFLSQRNQLATLAVQHGVPASYNLREFAKAAGPMSYGTSVTEASRQAGLFARDPVKAAALGTERATTVA